MSARGIRSYFASIVQSVCLHRRPCLGLRSCVQLGVLLLLLCGYGQATAVAQVQLAQEIETVAGNGTSGFSGSNGPAARAELGQPQGVAVDGAGNLYIADSFDAVIWKVTAATGTITVVAGNGTSGFSGNNGPATSAELGAPTSVAVDSAGNLYIADSFDAVIWKVTAATGTITVVAGNGTLGFSGQGGPATSAELGGPEGVGVDSAGNLYIADPFDAVIWKVTAATGTITVVAGNGTSGFSGQGGPATSAELGQPRGVAVDSAGNLYIADFGDSVIWKVTTATGTITEVAGNGTSGFSGDGGPAASAELNFPSGVVVDSAGNLYIADEFNSVIRKVTATTGTIATIAGVANGGGFSGNDGPATSAELGLPTGVAVDSAGNFYIADFGDDVVWKVFATTPPFPTTAVGGTSAAQNVFLQLNTAQTITGITATPSQGGKQEYALGTITGCTLGSSNPAGTICTVPVTFQPAYTGERGVSLQAVTGSGTFTFGLNGIGTGPQVALIPGTIVTAAGNGTEGFSGTGGAPTSAELNLPVGAAVDSAGDIFIADALSNVVWKVSAATGTITTIAGNGMSGFSGDGGAATSAELNTPSGVAVDSAGNLYIADVGNQRIRIVSAGTGLITTIAGNGMSGFSGDNGAATSAELNNPNGVTVDSAGNLYIADVGNQRIRIVSIGTGAITTIAGNGTSGFSGDNGAATSAELNNPDGVTVDSAGNLYIADSANNVIRLVSAATGLITTIAGNGTSGFSGDNGAGTSAELNNPDSVAVDGAGNIYIADTLNNRIRMVSAATGTITTVSGNGTPGFSGNNGAATGAELHTPISVALDSVGNLYIADSLNFVVREVQVTMPPPLTFPTPTVVGTPDTRDGPQTISVSNIGNATLTFPAPPSVAASFMLDSASTCPTSGSSATLPSGANCTLAVDFVPAMAGNISGSLVLMDNALNAAAPNFAMQSIALNGVGIMSATPLVPTLTFAPISTQVEGATPFAVSATSASTGAVTYAVTSGPATIAGNMVTVTGVGTVVLTANQAASGSYTAATATASFMVVGPFTLTSSTASMSVSAGAAASFSLMLTPATGTTLPDPIALTATGLPAGATATFSPATIAAGSSAATAVTLSIQTASAQAARNEQPITGNPLGPVALGFLLLPLMGIKAARRRLRQSLPLVLLAVGLSLAAVLGMSGCGGNSATPSPTPTPTPTPTPAPAAQTYTVVVTATDTTTMIQSMTNLTLTVQ
jgi:trimeric autotransporter adhesin